MPRDQQLSVAARQGDIITLRILPPSGQRALKARELRERLASKDLLLIEIRNLARQLPGGDLLLPLIERAREV